MKKIIFLTGIVMSALLFNGSSDSENPLLGKFDSPPFNEIKEEHYLPAYKTAIELHNAEIEEIVSNNDAPTFENTVAALDYSGEILAQVSSIFNNIKSSDTNEEIQRISKEAAPLLSKHNDDIYLNNNLFLKIKSVYDSKDKLALSTEQMTLLEEYYKEFIRGGAGLNDENKIKLREINEKLSLLSLKFSENVLKENNRFELVIENKEDLSGLPESVIEAAEITAKEKGYDGKWVFTIQKPSLIPFLQYSDKRELREKMFKAYIMVGDHNDELDNKEIAAQMVALRIRKANLLGYKTHAEYVLDMTMAKSPDKVYTLLDKIWSPALEMAKKEVEAQQEIIDKEGNKFKLQPWDWWYYSEKVRKEKFNLDENELRPYFMMENVRQGAFSLAEKLFGIKFTKKTDIQVYNPEVEVFEVTEENGKYIGLIFTDYYPRAGKGGGAWMDAFRKQYKKDSKNITPVIYNVGNFTRPTSDNPSLLSLDEVETLFHEFGHGLHGLLSNSSYPKLTGTSVRRDFVELPSQIMENWAFEPEFLKIYAKHYKTNEPIPDELIEKIKNSSHFNQGFATVEYLAASYLDMDLHTLIDSVKTDINTFEKESMNRIGLIPEIVPRYRITYYRHIFDHEYSAGYYSYIWAEVLDADAFDAFKEKGLFDRETGMSFRKNILERGGTEDPMKLYIQFRGREPEVGPLLKNRGLDKKDKGSV
jgi:peptidyl-dipeptidase Dcp